MEADKKTHQYKPDASFENAVALYEFDAELRELVLNNPNDGNFVIKDGNLPILGKKRKESLCFALDFS